MARLFLIALCLISGPAARVARADSGPSAPAALAIDYLRVLASRYREARGMGLPDEEALFAIDDGTARAIRSALRPQAARRGRATLARADVAREIARAVEAAFRSDVSPTALKLLLARFGVQGPHETSFLFVRERDGAKIAATLEAIHASPATLYVPVTRYFPDRAFLHGATTAQDVETIRAHGIFPTAFGGAGPGLYGAPEAAAAFALRWGGSADRVLRLELAPAATLVDLTAGEGLRAFEAYLALHPDADYDEFAEAVGADILRYPHRVPAFVVKSAAAISPTSAAPYAEGKAKASRSRFFSFFAGLVRP